MSDARANWDEIRWDPARWDRWRDGVVQEVRNLCVELRHTALADFDWEAWRPLFDAGLSPEVAVNEAMSSRASAANEATMEEVA
jgi:hypothetical protein